MAAKTRISAEQRREMGRALRQKVPRSSHADWSPPEDRADPVALLKAQNVDRVDWLAPIRRGRMMVSPLTFYRGAVRIIASIEDPAVIEKILAHIERRDAASSHAPRAASRLG